jgi:hypothetical protein
MALRPRPVNPDNPVPPGQVPTERGFPLKNRQWSGIISGDEARGHFAVARRISDRDSCGLAGCQ